jgi:glycerol-3-phosphate responsive antiterminator
MTAEFKALSKIFLTNFYSKQQMKDWIHIFFGLDLPDSFVDPESNSSPIDWMWDVYQMYRDNKCNESPSVITVSSRESYKTLSQSAMAVILMTHFNATICHMAAITSQAAAAQNYVQKFLSSISPYMTHHGREVTSQNIKEVKISDDNGNSAWMRIVVCTISGANSSHSNILCVSGKTDILIKNIKGTKRIRSKIGASKLYKLLQQGKEIEAYSFNHQTGKCEFKKIIAQYDNGNKKGVDVYFEDGTIVTCTPDHKFYSENGYEEISKLIGKSVYKITKQKAEDKIDNYKYFDKFPEIKYKEPEFNDVEQVIIGGLLGDMGCYKKRNYKDIKKGLEAKHIGNPHISFRHCVKQKDYAIWKMNILSKSFKMYQNKGAKSGYTGAEQIAFCSNLTKDLSDWFGFRKTLDGLDKIEALGLAVWFMDDGSGSRVTGTATLNTQSFTYEQNLKLKEVLKNKFDIDCVIKEYNTRGKKYCTIHIDVISTYKLYEITKKYIHPSLMYKFDGLLNKSIKKCKNCNSEYIYTAVSYYCSDVDCQAAKNRQLQKVKVIKIKPAIYNRRYYDFTVEGNHNFFSNGLLTHNCFDEIDTVRSKEGIRAYKEAQMIPGVFNGQHPLTIKTSTLKFPGGLFSKEIEMSRKENWKTFKWNIIDITEKCPESRHRPDLPKEDRYVRYELPMSSLTEPQYNDLTSKEKENYTKINTYSGCANCPILPVCRSQLAHRSESDKGGLWKPIDFTITQFKKTDPDLAEAQLLSRKPSSQGMVYPRFINKEDGTGNSYTVNQAWESYTGEKINSKIEFEDLINLLKKNELKFYAFLDWGFRHFYAIGVCVLMPNGEFWLVDSYSVAGLEFDQQLSLAIEVRDKYKPKKWFADTSAPQSIKTFNKNKMPCAEFKKDIDAGINAIRTQIVDASGVRRLKVIKTDRNELYFKMFAEHTFMLDQLGNITREPDDGEFADIADALRYAGQNLFQPKGKNHLLDQPQVKMTPDQIRDKYNKEVSKNYDNWLSKEINAHTDEKATGTIVSKSGSIVWDID